MELIWTNPVIEDLKEFKNYTKMIRPNEYISKLVKNVNLLTEQPYLGKIYSYINGYIIRQFVHEQHRIFYYINNSKIYIVSVVHYRQDLQSKYTYIKKYFEEK